MLLPAQDVVAVSADIWRNVRIDGFIRSSGPDNDFAGNVTLDHAVFIIKQRIKGVVTLVVVVQIECDEVRITERVAKNEVVVEAGGNSEQGSIVHGFGMEKSFF